MLLMVMRDKQHREYLCSRVRLNVGREIVGASRNIHAKLITIQ